MKYSPWAACAYVSSAFKDVSDGLAGLERAMRIRGTLNIVSADIRPYGNYVGCIPPYSCVVGVPDLEKAVSELEKTAEDAIALARRLVSEAKGGDVRKFEIQRTTVIGPAPDRRETLARPKRARTKAKRARRRSRK